MIPSAILLYLGGVAFASAHVLYLAWPRFQNRYFGVDSWKHLLAADVIRRERRVPDRIRGHFILEGPYDYPPLLPALLACLPRRAVLRWEWIVSPAIDGLHSLLVFGLTLWLTDSLAVALIAQGVYSLTPAVVKENTSLNTRSLGALLLSGTFLAMLAFLHSVEPVYLLGVVLVGFLLTHAHKHAVQGLLLAALVVSLWHLSPLPIGLFALVVASAAVLSGGFYLRRILPGHLAILGFWREQIAQGHFIGMHLLRGGRARWSRTLLNWNPFLLVGVALAFAMRTPAGGASADLYRDLLVWGLGLYVAAIAITWVRPLRFLGEGERYMEYVSLPLAVVTALGVQRYLIEGFSPLFLALIVLTGAFALRHVWRLQIGVARNSLIGLSEDLRRIIATLAERGGEVRLVSIPVWPSEPIAYLTRCRVLWHDSARVLPQLADFFPVLRSPLPQILKRFDVNYLLVHDGYVDPEELGLDETWEQVAGAGDFRLLRIAAPVASPTPDVDGSRTARAAGLREAPA